MQGRNRKNSGLAAAAVFAVVATAFTTPASAEGGCGKTKISTVQVQYSASDVLVRMSGQGWRKIGNATDADMDAKLSLVMTAMASGWDVQLIYNDGELPPCTDTGTVYTAALPVKIRVYAN